MRHVNGLTGVWRHDDNSKGGNAFLIGTDPESIGGAHEHTYWLIYSCSWTNKENNFVQASIAQIQKDNPGSASHIPFICMKTILDQDHPLHVETSLEPSEKNNVTNVLKTEKIKIKEENQNEEQKKIENKKIPDETLIDPSKGQAKPISLPSRNTKEQPIKLKIRICAPQKIK